MRKREAVLLGAAIAVVGGALFFVGPKALLGGAAPSFSEVGGTRAILEVAPGADVQGVTDKAKAVLERRADAVGWRNARVRTEDDRRLVVEVPRVTDTRKVAEIVGARGALSLHLVDPDPSDEATKLPQVDETMPPIAVRSKAWVTSEDIVDARPGVDGAGRPIANFRFDHTGTENFAKVTAQNVGGILAIVLDGKVLSAPRILEPITGGTGQISGTFSEAQARQLAALLRTGSLPDGLTLVSVEVVKGTR